MHATKYSACLELLFTEAPDFTDRFQLAKEAGFEAAEFWSWRNKDVERVRRALDETGLTLCAFVAEPMLPLTDPIQHEGFLNGLQDSIETAQKLGMKNPIAQAGNTLQGVPRQEQHDAIVKVPAKAAPLLEREGVTLLLEPLNTLVDHPGYYLAYTPKGLDIIEEVGSPNVKESEFQTLDELIAYAKENPGAITIGGSGSNTANHIGVLQLEQLADIDLTYVPFSGTGAAVPALLGGHVSALMSYTPVAVQYSDQIRALAIASEERVSFFPDAPTFAEQGLDITGGAYRGVAAPPGTPEDVVQTLTEAFEETTQRIAEEQEQMGFVITSLGGDEARELVEQAKEEYAEILEGLQ